MSKNLVYFSALTYGWCPITSFGLATSLLTILPVLGGTVPFFRPLSHITIMRSSWSIETSNQTRGNLWISEVKTFFYWCPPHIPQIVLRKILVFYVCRVFLFQKYSKRRPTLPIPVGYAFMYVEVMVGWFGLNYR